jgi:ATP-binding cassette, subfamily B, bacterial
MNSAPADLRWLRAFLLPHRLAIAALMLLSLGVSALVMVQPYLTKLLIDDGLLGKDFATLVSMALLIFGAGLASSLLGGVNRYFYTRLSGRVLFGIREHVYEHLQRLSPGFYARNRGGDLLSRLDGDVAEIQRFAVDSLFAGISGIFGLLGTIGFMLWLSPSLTLLALAMIPVQWLYLRFMRQRVQQRVRTMRERSADISSFLIESLQAMKYVQSIAAGARESARLTRLNGRYLDDLLRLQLTEFATSAVPANLTSAMRATVFIVGGHQVIAGNMALGSLIAFSTYLGMAMGPVQTLLGVYMALNRVRVNAERVRFLTMAEPDVNPLGCRVLDAGTALEIRLEDLGFRYPGESEWVLRHASASVAPGARIAVRAPSGSGKTTLVDLLLRHYDPDEGAILLDGHDLRELDLPAWRRQIALVSQDCVLFGGSIADNIRYVCPEASDESVATAARRARLGELIDRLPQGMDTAVGERGTRLSGGERQRIAIARALLQQPRLLILDEATSAIDAAAEREVMDEIDVLFPGVTRLVISHREQPLAGADMLITINAGALSSSR